MKESPNWLPAVPRETQPRRDLAKRPSPTYSSGALVATTRVARSIRFVQLLVVFQESSWERLRRALCRHSRVACTGPTPKGRSALFSANLALIRTVPKCPDRASFKLQGIRLGSLVRAHPRGCRREPLLIGSTWRLDIWVPWLRASIGRRQRDALGIVHHARRPTSMSATGSQRDRAPSLPPRDQQVHSVSRPSMPFRFDGPLEEQLQGSCLVHLLRLPGPRLPRRRPRPPWVPSRQSCQDSRGP